MKEKYLYLIPSYKQSFSKWFSIFLSITFFSGVIILSSNYYVCILAVLFYISENRDKVFSDGTGLSGSIAVGICAAVFYSTSGSYISVVLICAAGGFYISHVQSKSWLKVAVNSVSFGISGLVSSLVGYSVLEQSNSLAWVCLSLVLIVFSYWITNSILVSFAIAISNRENILKTIWLLIRSDLSMLVFGFAGALCGVTMLMVSPWVGIAALVSLLVLLDVFVISAPTGLAAIRQNWFLLTVRFGATIMAGVVGAVVTRAFDISVLSVLLGLLAAFVSALIVVALAVLARLGSSWPAWRRPDAALVSGIVALEILIPLAGGLIGVLWVTAGPTVAIVVASATLIGISLGVLWRRHRPESEPIDEELALGAVMLAMFDGLPDSVDSH